MRVHYTASRLACDFDTMVGFGYSLRMARRSGWEGGYLDYETLKLLLSQIEAIYEELGHEEQESRRNHKPSRMGRRDYRDELFLESDSEAAYCSVDDMSRGDESMNVLTAGEKDESKPFSLSYSHEITSSDEDSQIESGCGAKVSETLSAWTTWERESKGDKTAKNLSRGKRVIVEEDDSFFGGSRNVMQNAFFLAEGPMKPSNGILLSDEIEPSCGNVPVRRTYANEGTSLLPPSTPIVHGSALYNVSETMTPSPTRRYMHAHLYDTDIGRMSPPAGISLPSLGTVAYATPSTNPDQNLVKKLQEERRRERQLRRQRRRRHHRIDQARERKVSRQLRIAHTKARAITERFLGLLRAETEKVLLFSQSRLGELADTAGSLRFPVFEDDFYGSTNFSHRQDVGGKFDYNLSDGGLHPSASSSDDEGAVGQGLFPWSESSDDDDQASSQEIPKNDYGSSHIYKTTGGDVAPRKNRPSRLASPELTVHKHKLPEPDAVSPAVLAARRQIAHFAEIRASRPPFQRNDHILGEDMLFLSAIEEVDGYTAVGVELMHVLRFICVNLIAVRKLCRKHDRLSSQRMLGGYYSRVKGRPSRQGENSHSGDARTLGGLLAQSSGDIYEVHPALVGQINHGKLVGLYDKKIQKLANSRTVQVISSCLALALSEYEVARSRANALTKLNSSMRTSKRAGSTKFRDVHDDHECASPFDCESDEADADAPSSASSISLTRLRFAVSLIFALREAARYKMNHHAAYIARSIVAFSGTFVTGEGLDGCSRETLDLLVSLNPDSVILLDPSILYLGLLQGRWISASPRDLMNTALATATIPETSSLDRRTFDSIISSRKAAVSNALSILPEGTKTVLFSRPTNNGLFTVIPASDDAPVMKLHTTWLNCISALLWHINYYTAHASAISIIRKANSATAASSIFVIGVPNISALIVAVVHGFLISQETFLNNILLSQTLFTCAALFGIFGNILHAVAFSENSIPLLVVARFVIGLSSADVLNRFIVTTCAPAFVVAEASRLFHYRTFGILLGLSFGAASEAINQNLSFIYFGSIELLCWALAVLWFIFFVQVRLLLKQPSASSAKKHDGGDNSGIDIDDDKSTSSSDSEFCSTMLTASLSEMPRNFPTIMPFGKRIRCQSLKERKLEKRQGACNKMKLFASRLKKLYAFNVCLPIVSVAMFYSIFGIETFFSVSPIIFYRYFNVNGVASSLYLTCLALFIIPMNRVCAKIAMRDEERLIIKKGLFMTLIGLFFMLNWASLFLLLRKVPNLLKDMENGSANFYDERFGLFQYTIGLVVTFTGFVCIQGASMALLSKVSPRKFRSYLIDVGTISSIIIFSSRLLADIQIVAMDLSHKLINADLINSLVVPIGIAAVGILYLVKRHFFFLY